tara:strand:- start:108 stop:392 length:285 start_codon:yes stop_codon:yes gene_type:complete
MGSPTGMDGRIITTKMKYDKNQTKFNMTFCVYRNLRILIAVNIAASEPFLLMTCSTTTDTISAMTNGRNQKSKKFNKKKIKLFIEMLCLQSQDV